MPAQSNPANLSVGEIARQVREQMIPIGNRFSYFVTALPLAEEDLKEYLHEPLSALPPSIRAMLPKIAILLVPYLEKATKKCGAGESQGDRVCFEEPDPKCWTPCSRFMAGDTAVLAFAIKDQDVAEYHFRLYQYLADLAAEAVSEKNYEDFCAVVRDELAAGAHGEVDEGSWQLKQALLQRQRNLRRKTKGFAKYARQAFVDTLTLYLHGICCDIDVETGPRQLASRYLRRRLELLQSLYPPPEGYAVFPENLNGLTERPKPSARPRSL